MITSPLFGWLAGTELLPKRFHTSDDVQEENLDTSWSISVALVVKRISHAMAASAAIVPFMVKAHASFLDTIQSPMEARLMASSRWSTVRLKTSAPERTEPSTTPLM